MKTLSVTSESTSVPTFGVEEGWYLLRSNLSHNKHMYRAGTLVEYLEGGWFVQGPLEEREQLSLSSVNVCRTHYEGVSLYEIECIEHEGVLTRPVLSTLSLTKVDPMMVQVPLRVGESRVCVRFGHCFLPLEFFNW